MRLGRWRSAWIHPALYRAGHRREHGVATATDPDSMRLARLPAPVVTWLRRRLARVTARAPDRIVWAAAGGPYLARWYLWPSARARRVNASRPALYLHGFHDSDIGHLHDHPWPSISIIVDGECIEHVPLDARDPAGPTRALRRRPGDVTLRAACSPHRIEIPRDQSPPILTLFAVGRRRRAWGFWCPRGWRAGPDFKRVARIRGDPAGGCE